MDLKVIKKKMPKEIEIYDLADFFKTLGDSTRTKILYALEGGELCVGEICECVDMTKSAVSHQLRILRQARLVKSRKEGKEVYYSFDDEHVRKVFEFAMEHIKE